MSGRWWCEGLGEDCVEGVRRWERDECGSGINIRGVVIGGGRIV